MEYDEIAAKRRKKRKSSFVYAAQYGRIIHSRGDFTTDDTDVMDAGRDASPRRPEAGRLGEPSLPANSLSVKSVKSVVPFLWLRLRRAAPFAPFCGYSPVPDCNPSHRLLDKPVSKPLALLASALICCASNLPAQTAPTITPQPTNQTVLAGSNATFTVAVAGTGPFTYQWQFNGANLPNNIITTVVGNGSATYAGDGGPATNASLHDPVGLAFDSVGDLYIADQENGRIRKVDTNGVITTAGYNDFPTGLALDAAGNLYFSDFFENMMFKVASNGIETIIAGLGDLGGEGVAATNAKIYNPFGIASDAAGNLFFADKFSNRVRKIGTNGMITTVAGNGGSSFSGDGGAATNAGLYYPVGVALDGAGNLFIADQINNLIRKVDTNGIITSVAGNRHRGFAGDGGKATNANLNLPNGVALDAVGNLYLQTKTTIVFAWWIPTAPLPPWLGTGLSIQLLEVSPAMAARQSTPAYMRPSKWLRMPSATCISRMPETSASARFILPDCPHWR